MAATDNDTLMYFIPKGSDPIAAECSAVLTANDKLTSDFKKGRYFEIESFVFGLRLEDNEATARRAVAGAAQNAAVSARSYARWRAIRQDGVKPSPPYPAETEDFVITRRIDTSSPILLQYCLDTQRLDKAVLVKRGRGNSGDFNGFLRMEFSKIWLKAIDWSDGDVVHESCRFQFSSVAVTYLKRKPDGSTASSWPCKWDGLANG